MSSYSSALRLELSQRAERYASENCVPSYQSIGSPSTCLFEPFDATSRHGNFIDASYRAICDDPNWSRRLNKVHSQLSALPEEKRRNAKEMDSCNSSDALLMNCFCYPEAAARIITEFFPDHAPTRPEFGVPGKIALTDGRQDTTEIDMKIGSATFEAKLTEKDFTSRPKPHVKRYARFQDVFEVNILAQTAGDYLGYQLIRNVLAAEQYSWVFCVICDARRPDLLREWWIVHSAIRSAELRSRCRFLLWQEIASTCPKPLSLFLRAKYGFGE